MKVRFYVDKDARVLDCNFEQFGFVLRWTPNLTLHWTRNRRNVIFPHFQTGEITYHPGRLTDVVIVESFLESFCNLAPDPWVSFLLKSLGLPKMDDPHQNYINLCGALGLQIEDYKLLQEWYNDRSIPGLEIGARVYHSFETDLRIVFRYGKKIATVDCVHVILNPSGRRSASRGATC